MKRGMMPAATPDNPMGQSQKYMMYIMPFFALSGLYWPFGLVLYWVTTNCWTLGQQWVLFRTQPQLRAAGAAGAAGATAAVSPAVAPVVTTRPKRAIAGPPKPGSTGSPDGQDVKKDGQRGAAAPQSNGAAKPAAAKPAAAKPAARRNPDGSAPGSAGRKASAARGPAAKAPGTSGSARQGVQPSANGSGTGGGAGGMLRRLGKRAEPEPEPSAPEVKLVRQQRQRQSRSKRSGKR
jgi:YidC/Oxa1 family membrane protein insertase